MWHYVEQGCESMNLNWELLRELVWQKPSTLPVLSPQQVSTLKRTLELFAHFKFFWFLFSNSTLPLSRRLGKICMWFTYAMLSISAVTACLDIAEAIINALLAHKPLISHLHVQRVVSHLRHALSMSSVLNVCLLSVGGHSKGLTLQSTTLQSLP